VDNADNFLQGIPIPVTLEKGASIPVYATEGSSGADIHAYLPEGAVTLKPGAFQLIPTGVRMEIPRGFEVQVRPRSGLAAKFGVTVLNTPGTIDSDYRGEVKVILINHSNSNFIVRHGERIAQLVTAKTETVKFNAHEQLLETTRGEGGFGSTGT
jgi:dUTP pyrophosphatase